MEGNTETLISGSLDAEPKLLPFLPYLLQDLWSLGCSVDSIINSLRKLGANSSSTLLDLGCGKGAVAITAAAEFKCRVTGVDAMVPFLEEAEKRAMEYGVGGLCSFIYQDINDYTANSCNFDFVIMASLGGVLGKWEDIIGKLRTQVKPGGYILIDDGYLKRKSSTKRRGYTHYLNYDETVKKLTSKGDKLVEAVTTAEESLNINNEYTALIKKRGGELIDENPELEAEIKSYLALQEEECKFIEEELEGVLWILQRSRKH